MGINFPNSPTVGQQYPSPAVAGQPVWQWDGEKWTAGPQVTNLMTVRNFLGGVNLDTVVDDGYYVTDGTCTNVPGTGQWYIHVARYHADTLSVIQFAYKLYPGTTPVWYMRTKWNPTGWSAWQLQWTVGQLPANIGTTQPAAGFVGERKLQSGGNNFPASGTTVRVAVVTLETGIWDLEAFNTFGGPGATSSSDWNTAINTVDATLGGGGQIALLHTRRPAGADISEAHMIPRHRFVVGGASQPVYLNAAAIYTVSTYRADGYIIATRV